MSAKTDAALSLLHRDRRYRGTHMHSAFRALGAGMSERRGTVQSWVQSLSADRLDDLIRDLGGDPDAIAADEAHRLSDWSDR